MNEKLISTAARIFGLVEGQVTMDSTPKNTKNWDSLGHMRLILETEEIFGVEFDEDEITSIVDIRTLAAAIETHRN